MLSSGMVCGKDYGITFDLVLKKDGVLRWNLNIFMSAIIVSMVS